MHHLRRRMPVTAAVVSSLVVATKALGSYRTTVCLDHGQSSGGKGRRQFLFSDPNTPYQESLEYHFSVALMTFLLTDELARQSC